MAKLVVLNKGSAGTAFELKAERNTVGRVDDNTLTIPESSVSSHHCEILVKENEITVKDLESTNGTFVDGNRVTESGLKPGQTLRLGNLELRLETEEMAKEKKPAPAKGIKADELEFGHQPAALGQDSMFAKKSDNASKIFITVGVALGVIIVGFLIYAVFLAIQTQP